MKYILFAVISLNFLACTKKPKHQPTPPQTAQQSNPSQVQEAAFTCKEGSPSFVIFDEVDQSYKYCSNGLWKETNPVAQKNEHHHVKPLEMDHEIPSAHSEFSKPQRRVKRKTTQLKSDTFWCRSNSDQDNYKCSLSH